MPITHGGTSIGAHSKHPERALMAYELIRQNEEVYKLINFELKAYSTTLKMANAYVQLFIDDARDGFYTDFWVDALIDSTCQVTQTGPVLARFTEYRCDQKTIPLRQIRIRQNEGRC